MSIRSAATSGSTLVMVDKPQALVTDREAALLRQVAHHQRKIRFCESTRADCGNICRSNAWEFARGTYVLYVDYDEFLLPDALAILQERAAEASAASDLRRVSDRALRPTIPDHSARPFANLRPQPCRRCAIAQTDARAVPTIPTSAAVP